VRGLQSARSSAGLRARRWDAVVLGGALPGLVAAARLGMEGLRVLVVEEDTAARGFAGLREPFFLPGTAAGGVLDACLRALTVPLIDRKKLETDPIAFQVVLPEARIDVGEPHVTAEEWVAWGLAKPEQARGAVRALQEAAAAERGAMLEAPVVRSGGLRGLARGGARPARHGRGLPLELASPPAALAPVLEAQVRALSNLAAAAPPPEARARLLGSALEGGAGFALADGFLRGLLRRRIQALFGEFRLLPGRFDLVAVGEHPGIAPQGGSDVWLGRALILNAPRALLARALPQEGAAPPEFLDAPPPTHRRVGLHLRAHRAVLPEAMARRVIRVGDPGLPLEGTNLVTIGIFPAGGASDAVDLAVASVVPAPQDAAESARVEAELEAAARALLPFSEGRVVRGASSQARWDDDAWLTDPGLGEGWPGEVEIRASSRPLVYALPRDGVASLGSEGDLLLGWRAGDAIRTELGGGKGA